MTKKDPIVKSGAMVRQSGAAQKSGGMMMKAKPVVPGAATKTGGPSGGLPNKN